MIPPFLFRSMIFNLLFYLLTAISCIVLLPTLLLPRKYFLTVVNGFVHTTEFLEKYILGLTFEVRGLEHLPVQGPYLIAAKHQSAYETTKLHILFHDPAIVLKKELLKIPLWGWYLAKSDVIAIDRSTPKAAVQSIQAGAKRMASQGRPIVIFPQGTRVSVRTTVEQRPYKIGIVRLQEATGLPIIPMALNTGVFWPRNSLFKKPGHVVFEFLPPILPGADASTILADIQNGVEEKTLKLIAEGLQSIPKINKKSVIFYTLSFIACGIAWTANWFVAATFAQDTVKNFIVQLRNEPDYYGSVFAEPSLGGFPFRIALSFPEQKISTHGQHFEIHGAVAKSWPFLGFPVSIKTGAISVFVDGWSLPMAYDSFEGKFLFKKETLKISYMQLKKSEFEANVDGKIHFNPPYPAIDLMLNFKNHENLLQDLVGSKAVRSKDALIAGVTLGSLKKKDGVSLKLTSSGRNIYLGPIRVYQFPNAEEEPALLENGEVSGIATKRQKPSELKPVPDQ